MCLLTVFFRPSRPCYHCVCPLTHHCIFSTTHVSAPAPPTVYHAAPCDLGVTPLFRGRWDARDPAFRRGGDETLLFGGLDPPSQPVLLSDPRFRVFPHAEPLAPADCVGATCILQYARLGTHHWRFPWKPSLDRPKSCTASFLTPIVRFCRRFCRRFRKREHASRTSTCIVCAW